MPAEASPRFLKRFGAVTSVNAAGSQSGTSSHSSGIDTRASGSGRTDHADATVRSWRSGCSRGRRHGVPPSTICSSPAPARDAPPRAPSASAARVATGQSSSVLDAHVDMDPARSGRLGPPRNPMLASHIAHVRATRRTSSQPHAGTGTRSNAQLVGMVEVIGAHRMRVQSIQPRLTTQRSCAASRMTISRAVRPDGKRNSTFRSTLDAAPGRASERTARCPHH